MGVGAAFRIESLAYSVFVAGDVNVDRVLDVVLDDSIKNQNPILQCHLAKNHIECVRGKQVLVVVAFVSLEQQWLQPGQGEKRTGTGQIAFCFVFQGAR